VPGEAEVFMKIYGHPWSTNTRKTLMTLAEKGQRAEFVLVMIPKGEQRHPEHLARHPFGKVPVLDDDGFVLYETRAINAYLDRKLGGGAALVPRDDRASARIDQWINVADAYFIPHAQPLLVETIFRRFLGGEQNGRAIAAGREGMQPALDAADRHLESSSYFGSSSLSIADIHWMPYVDYLVQTGQGEPITRRAALAAWWERVSKRDAWQRVARSGPQPYDPGITADVIEKQLR
jgi:glutathione S-transferase